MSYSKQLSDFRNQMHSDIVLEATVKNTINGNDINGVLLLKEPLVFREWTVSSVCCETGLLISSDNDKIVPYYKLTIEELDVVHSMVCVSKKYTFTLNTQLV
jgi:hypothetical protein